MSRSMALTSKMLVFGAAGVGKSTLIKQMIADSEEKYDESKMLPECGDHVRGVTKFVTSYRTRINSRDWLIYDTPGIGDADRDAEEVIKMLCNKLFNNPVNAIILCVPAGDRYGTAPQLLTKFCSLLLERSRWDTLLIVGTKKDKLTKKKGEKWVRQVVKLVNQEYDGNISEENIVLVSSKVEPDLEDSDDEGVNADINSLYCRFRAIELSGIQLRQPTTDEFVKIMKSSGFKVEGRKIARMYEHYIAAAKRCWGSWKEGITNLPAAIAKGDLLETLFYLGSSTHLPIAASFGLMATFSYAIQTDTSPLEYLRLDLPTNEERDCALLSAVIYEINALTYWDSHFLKKNLANSSEAVHCYFVQEVKDRGDIPVLLVAKGLTLYVVFRGTNCGLNWATNLNANPSQPGWLVNWTPNVCVHSGIGNLTEQCFIRNFDTISKMVEKYKIETVIYSGHSLGGAIAQTMTCMSLAKKQKYISGSEKIVSWERAGMVEFRAVTFAAPMIFSMPPVKDQKQRKWRESFVQHFNSRYVIKNWIFGMDLIPHLPGNIDFVVPACKYITSLKIKKKFFAAPLFGVTEGIFGELQSQINKSDLRILKQYRHIGAICYISSIKAPNGKDTNYTLECLLPDDFLKKAKFFEDPFIIDHHSILPFRVKELLKINKQRRCVKQLEDEFKE